MPVFETETKNEVVFLENKKDKKGNYHLEVKRVIHENKKNKLIEEDETPEATVKELIKHGKVLMSSTIYRSFSFETSDRHSKNIGKIL